MKPFNHGFITVKYLHLISFYDKNVRLVTITPSQINLCRRSVKMHNSFTFFSGFSRKFFQNLLLTFVNGWVIKEGFFNSFIIIYFSNKIILQVNSLYFFSFLKNITFRINYSHKINFKYCWKEKLIFYLIPVKSLYFNSRYKFK